MSVLPIETIRKDYKDLVGNFVHDIFEGILAETIIEDEKRSEVENLLFDLVWCVLEL